MIDTSRTNNAYAAGVGILLLAALAGSNVPELAFSAYFDLPYRKFLCAGLFLAGSLTGCWAFMRATARSSRPWQVPQAQVTLPYTLFFILSLAAVVIAR